MPPPTLGKADSFQCVVPEEHVAGEKLCYLEPSGSRIFLDVPPDAKPGETIEFELPDDGPPPTLSMGPPPTLRPRRCRSASMTTGWLSMPLPMVLLLPWCQSHG